MPLPLGRLAQAKTAAPTESTSFLAPVAELPEPVGRRLQQVGWHLVGYLRILLLVCAHFAAEPAAQWVAIGRLAAGLPVWPQPDCLG